MYLLQGHEMKNVSEHFCPQDLGIWQTHCQHSTVEDKVSHQIWVQAARTVKEPIQTKVKNEKR